MRYLALAAVFLLLATAPISSAFGNLSETSTPITHLILLTQENHSFDNYFGTYPTSNGTLGGEIVSQLQSVDGLPNGTCLPIPAGCLSPYHAQAGYTENPIEGRDVYEKDYDNGKIDGFAAYSGPQSMSYFDYHEIPAYWDYAEEYGLADNYFASAMTTTTPNRLLLLSGDTLVSSNYGPPPYVAFNQTIFAQLSSRGISWGYFDFIAHLNQTTEMYPLNYLSNFDTGTTGVVQDVSMLFRDLAIGRNLPSVSFVNAIASDGLDEHPPQNVTAGALWVVSVVNAVMQSSYWNSSAVFITYDEGGGYYDHVPPPQVLEIDHGFDRPLRGYGQRVPFLVISPYAKENYVSRTVLNHMSILRFIDFNWNLPPLNQHVRDSNNLLDFFYFGIAREPIILGNGTPHTVTFYPLPIQIPFDQLPYARTGSWDGDNRNTVSTPSIFLGIVSVVALSVVLLLIGRRRLRTSVRSSSSSSSRTA